MSAQPGTVFIVDDDPDVCRALGRLLRSAGYATRTFACATDFLIDHEPEPAGCILLDLSMPDLNGLELQQCLAVSGCRTPIIFLTANGDVHNTVLAMKAGAVNFLTKPVDNAALIEAIEEALKIDAAGRARWVMRTTLVGRLATLTPRERQVLEKVVAGRLNKQIAAELGTVEKTIKVHRARGMRKLHAGSLIELVQIAGLAGLEVKADCIQDATARRH
jgi:FixJ family two-component response regulator